MAERSGTERKASILNYFENNAKLKHPLKSIHTEIESNVLSTSLVVENPADHRPETGKYGAPRVCAPTESILPSARFY